MPNVRSACSKTIPDKYIIHAERMCNCCHGISLDQDKQCYTCKEVKHITLLEKPYLFRCQECMNARFRVKKYVDKCNCSVTVGSWSRYLKSKKRHDNVFE